MASTIEQILRDNSTYIDEGVNFYLGSKDFFNEEADDATFVFPPGFNFSHSLFMVEHNITAEEEFNQHGTFQPVYDIMVLVLKSYEPDSGGVVSALFNDPAIDEARNTLINSCREICREFISSLMSDKRIATNGIMKPKTTPLFNLFDSNLDGIMLTMRLKTNDVVICKPKHDGPKM